MRHGVLLTARLSPMPQRERDVAGLLPLHASTLSQKCADGKVPGAHRTATTLLVASLHRHGPSPLSLH